jgi:4-hydroxy-3-methylbut-2-enyl diphosphate reductase
MGQFDTAQGGAIYLVETPEDVARLRVRNPAHMAYVTQTTLSMDDTAKVIDALRQYYPQILGPRKDDICYATTNRQDAVKQLAGQCEALLVVGSKNSSNSNRLRELAELMGTPAYLIDGAADIDAAWVQGKARVGVTAGASAPEILVRQVVERLQQLGGVAQSVVEAAKARGLTVFDATCPLVTKVHIEVKRYAREQREVVLIGHEGHPEVEGTMGQFDTTLGGAIYLVETPEDVERLPVKNPAHMAYVTQTTLSMDDTAKVIDALRQRFPLIMGPRKDDICYATTNRQDAVKQLAAECNVMLVVGSKNSSNSNRLRELSELLGTPAYLIDGAEDIDPGWVEGRARVGVTAGASAPEVLVKQVVARLQSLGGKAPQEMSGRAEHIVFSLPPALRRAVREQQKT